MGKVIVGLSGGVDSSVAAFLLKEQGYDVVGVSMNVWDESTVDKMSANPTKDAREVAKFLDISFYEIDYRKEFRECVVNNFVEEYLNGRTPNPCNRCNKYMKWDAMLKKAEELGADYIATGHYAKIKKTKEGRFYVANAESAKKDQTYALCMLTQEQLSKTLMPLGEYSKEEVRKIALDAGIPVAEKKESQDICFIPDNDYAGFLEREVPERIPPRGNFVLKDGKVLGEHEGITHYTIGQRRGLGLPMGHRVVVTKIDAMKNEVVIGENEDVFTCEVIAKDVSFMGLEKIPEEGIRLLGKIRYAHAGEWCFVKPLGEGIICRFEKPVRAATPGQTLCLYDGECVAAAGIIQ